MTECSLPEQAAAITTLLPKLMRQLFMALEAGDPTCELPLTQVRICNILFIAPRSMSALSREIGISLSAVTQIADRMEHANLVERIIEGDDRRVKSLQLTAHGGKLMQARRERRVQRTQQVIGRLPVETRAAILQVLQQMLEAATEISAYVPGDVEISELLES